MPAVWWCSQLPAVLIAVWWQLASEGYSPCSAPKLLLAGPQSLVVWPAAMQLQFQVWQFIDRNDGELEVSLGIWPWLHGFTQGQMLQNLANATSGDFKIAQKAQQRLISCIGCFALYTSLLQKLCLIPKRLLLDRSFGWEHAITLFVVCITACSNDLSSFAALTLASPRSWAPDICWTKPSTHSAGAFWVTLLPSSSAGLGPSAVHEWHQMKSQGILIEIQLTERVWYKGQVITNYYPDVQGT